MSISIWFLFSGRRTTRMNTLSLHDALPISRGARRRVGAGRAAAALHHRRSQGDAADHPEARSPRRRDRKSTRLNSSHANISYAVFCLKNKIIDASPHTNNTEEHDK